MACSTKPMPPMSLLEMQQKNEGGPGENRGSYRQQVIRALVQRYIESARREFEETKRKGKTEKVFLISSSCFVKDPIKSDWLV